MPDLVKKPYNKKFPSAAKLLMDQGITATPRQIERDLRWAEGIDIVYTLQDLTPANFEKYADTLLLLASQEGARYEEHKWKFASFDVKLGRLKKGRDIPEVASFQASMHQESEILVYGPGYEVPQKHFLYNKVDDIKEITKRYQEGLSKQNPYKVIRLTISIREPRLKPGEGAGSIQMNKMRKEAREAEKE